MRTGRWRWLWGAVVVLIGAITALCICLWPNERPLLNQARRVAAIDRIDYGFYPSNQWISDDTTVSITDKVGIVFHELPTGRSRHVSVRYWPMGTHTHTVWSPDGQWLLSYDGGGGDLKVVGTEVQTGHTLSWPNLGNVYHLENCWLSDSRRWLQYPTLEDGYVTIYSVDHPHLATKLNFPDSEWANWRWMDHCLTSKDHLLIYYDVSADNGGLPPDDSFDGRHLSVREYRLLPSVVLLNTHRVISPNGQRIRNVVFSPTGDRVAMLCDDTYVSSLLVWLHKWLPHVAATPKPRLSLWVSPIDGGNPHEIGYLPNAITNADAQPDISSLQWLPGGKRLSFVYKDSLYTVPAD